MTQDESRTAQHEYSRLLRRPAFFLGLAWATVLFLFGVQNIFASSTAFVLWGVLTGLCSVGAFYWLRDFLAPRLNVFSVRMQFVLAGVSVALGGVVFVLSPLSMPLNVLFMSFLPLELIRPVSWLTGWAAVSISGGTLFLTMLAGVIGTEKPLYPRFPVVALVLIGYLLCGLAVYDDYGISHDEVVQRLHGQVSVKHMLSYLPSHPYEDDLATIPEMDDYPFKSYSVAFHVPVVLFELVNGISESPDLWLFRHYVTFLFFFCGVLAVYRCGVELYGHWLYGLIAALFLMMTPRIFAESFYNVKDTVFLAAFAIALYAAIRYWRTVEIRYGVLFAIAVAFATNIRIIGLGLLVLVVGIGLLDMLTNRKSGRYRRWSRSILVMLGVYLVSYVVFAPASWSNPVAYLLTTLRTFVDFPWGGYITYMGEVIPGDAVPWHFIPVWMLITIPLSYTLLFVIGLGAILREVWQKRRRLVRDLWQFEGLICLLLLVTPVLVAIVRDSTLYNGWRHFAFIYVPFLLIALRGVQVLYQFWQSHRTSSKALRGLLIVTGAALLLYQGTVLRWMVVNHPYQNVYFNESVELFGGREGFERDYWGLSVRQGLEYVLEHDTDTDIEVFVQNVRPRDKVLLLPSHDMERVTLVDSLSDSTDYLMNLHWTPEPNYTPPDAPVYHQIVVDGLPILTVYDMN